MKEKRDEILNKLCKSYEALGEDLYLLTALMAYWTCQDTEEMEETGEDCIRRLSGDMGNHAGEIICLSAALNRQK